MRTFSIIIVEMSRPKSDRDVVMNGICRADLDVQEEIFSVSPHQPIGSDLFDFFFFFKPNLCSVQKFPPRTMYADCR